MISQNSHPQNSISRNVHRIKPKRSVLQLIVFGGKRIDVVKNGVRIPHHYIKPVAITQLNYSEYISQIHIHIHLHSFTCCGAQQEANQKTNQ